MTHATNVIRRERMMVGNGCGSAQASFTRCRKNRFDHRLPHGWHLRRQSRSPAGGRRIGHAVQRFSSRLIAKAFFLCAPWRDHRRHRSQSPSGSRRGPPAEKAVAQAAPSTTAISMSRRSAIVLQAVVEITTFTSRARAQGLMTASDRRRPTLGSRCAARG